MSATDVVFRFESRNLAVELEGPEAFVEAQVARVLARIRAELAAAIARDGDGHATDAPGAAGDPTPEPDGTATEPSLAEFHRRAQVRAGRGGLQDSILVFAYYLSEIRGRREFGIGDLDSCFSLAAVTPPAHLANTLGVMKRAQGLVEAGQGRGRYVLTDKGVAYVRRLIGAQ